MSAPVAPAWGELDGPAKRERALVVARELFARDGLEVTMPALAEAIGVGVGSLYRQVGHKDDIVAALLAERLREMEARLAAVDGDADAWSALWAVAAVVVEECCVDRFGLGIWGQGLARPEVVAAKAGVSRRLEAAVDRARAAGALRDDAGVEDLRLVFRAVKEVGMDPAAGWRLAELALRGMRA
jgi:AcrR family transcriptional regulator